MEWAFISSMRSGPAWHRPCGQTADESAELRMALAHLGKGLPAVKMICNNYIESSTLLRKRGTLSEESMLREKSTSLICIPQQAYCKNGKPTGSHCPGLSKGPPDIESLCLLAEREILLFLGAYLLSVCTLGKLKLHCKMGTFSPLHNRGHSSIHPFTQLWNYLVTHYWKPTQ